MAGLASYRDQILERLSGKLDSGIFERCMGDLLREDLPGSVRAVGGSDSGFDGASPTAMANPMRWLHDVGGGCCRQATRET